MGNTSSLSQRLDAEFAAVIGKMKELQADQVKEYEQRKERLVVLGKALDQVRNLWGPGLDLLVKRLGNHVKVSPKRTTSRQERDLEFESSVARVCLKFAASTDRDVQKLVLEYDLEIIPVLLHFEPHHQLELPLDKLDWQQITGWIDDRIVEFARTYLSMLQNDHYIEDQMVEDPVAHVRFPKFAAATSIDWNGRTWYFIRQETRRDFEDQHGIGHAPEPALTG
jgi:YHS domain-containing protein